MNLQLTASEKNLELSELDIGKMRVKPALLQILFALK